MPRFEELSRFVARNKPVLVQHFAMRRKRKWWDGPIMAYLPYEQQIKIHFIKTVILEEWIIKLE